MSIDTDSAMLENLCQAIYTRRCELRVVNAPLRKWEQTTLVSVSVHPRTTLSLLAARPPAHKRHVEFDTASHKPSIMGLPLIETLDALDADWRINEHKGVIT